MGDFEFFFYINFIIFLYRFKVLILKINFLKYIYFLIYFQLKNTLKNYCHHYFKYTIRIDWRNKSWFEYDFIVKI